MGHLRRRESFFDKAGGERHEYDSEELTAWCRIMNPVRSMEQHLETEIFESDAANHVLIL